MTFARVIYDVVARDGASRTFRHMGDEAGYAEGRVARFGRAFAAVGIGIGIAGVAIAAEAVRMGTTFQAEMTRIQTQAGASAGAVKQLQGEVLRLAQSHAQQGPNELAMALYHLKSVGLDNVHAMRALRVASDLAAVGGSNLEDTTSALAGAWRSGIKGAQSFGKTAATVNAIIGAGNMRMTDFIASLSSGILPAARTFHVSLSSVGSALALMTDEGIPAEVAATRLRMTLSLIGAPSAKAAGALSTIGLRADDLAKKLMQPGPSGGLVGAIALLKQHLDASGQSAVQQAQTIAHAFGGGRSSSAIETLLNNLGVLEKKQTQINNTTGKYGAAVVAQRKTAEAQFHRLSSIIEAAGVRIGLALLPPVTAFVSFIVNRALPAVGTFGSRVGQVFNAIIPVGAIKRDWQDLMQFLGLAKPKPVHLVTGDLLHLPRPAPLYAGDLLHARPSPMLDLIHPLPKTAGDQLVAPLKAGIIAALSGSGFGMALGHALGTAFGWLGQHSAVFIGGLVNTLAHLDWVSIGKAVGGNALGFAIGFISNLGADLFSPSFWEHHWWDLIVAVLSVGLVGKFIGPVEKIISHVPVLRLFSPFLKGIQKVGTPIFDTVYSAVKGIGRAFIKGFGDVFPGTFARLSKWLDLLPTRIGVWAIRIYDLGRRALVGLGNGILRGAEGLGKIIGTIIKRLIDPFRPAGLWLVESGINLVKGLLGGIRRYMAGIASWVKGNIVNPIVHWVTHFFGISSPSKVMFGLGGHIMTGLLHGIMSGGRNLGGMVRKVFGSIPSALGHLVEKGMVSISSLPGRALRALGGLGSGLLGGIANLLGFSGGSGVAQWGSTVEKVLGMLGLPKSYTGMWLRQIATESGGNRFAVNLTDSNAAAGHPSMGVLQTIMSTFLAYSGPFRSLGVFNGLADIFAGINYALHRYGRAGMLGVIGQGHGYWQGGPITEPITGIGRSGRSYSFGENGLQEWVTRGRPGGRGVNGGLTGGPLIHADQLVVQDATDAELVARKLAFRVMAASMGGNG